MFHITLKIFFQRIVVACQFGMSRVENDQMLTGNC